MQVENALYHTEIRTPLGILLAFANDHGICRTEFKDSPVLGLSQLSSQALVKDSNIHLLNLVTQLEAYFLGHRLEFTLPLTLDGSLFQMMVWNRLLQIPYGTTLSYKDQSIALNKPSAVRAIANANGRNPISILIPCHRVIASNGKLSGYSGGTWRKKWLLEHERSHAPRAYQLL